LRNKRVDILSSSANPDSQIEILLNLKTWFDGFELEQGGYFKISAISLIVTLLDIIYGKLLV